MKMSSARLHDKKGRSCDRLYIYIFSILVYRGISPRNNDPFRLPVIHTYDRYVHAGSSMDVGRIQGRIIVMICMYSDTSETTKIFFFAGMFVEASVKNARLILSRCVSLCPLRGARVRLFDSSLFEGYCLAGPFTTNNNPQQPPTRQKE